MIECERFSKKQQADDLEEGWKYKERMHIWKTRKIVGRKRDPGIPILYHEFFFLQCIKKKGKKEKKPLSILSQHNSFLRSPGQRSLKESHYLERFFSHMYAGMNVFNFTCRLNACSDKNQQAVSHQIRHHITYRQQDLSN